MGTIVGVITGRGVAVRVGITWDGSGRNGVSVGDSILGVLTGFDAVETGSALPPQAVNITIPKKNSAKNRLKVLSFFSLLFNCLL